VPSSLDSQLTQQSRRKASHSRANDSAAFVGTVGRHVSVLPGSFGYCLIAEVVLEGC